jgi:hypothetical protein
VSHPGASSSLFHAPGTQGAALGGAKRKPEDIAARWLGAARCAWVGIAVALALLLTAAPALASPGIRAEGVGAPFVEVEEFTPGATVASADLYLFARSSGGQPATVRFQYVDAAAYQPAEPDPYAAGATATLATGLETESEIHLHLSLATETTYYWRILATSSQGTTEVQGTTDTHAPSLRPLPDARAYEQVSPPDKNYVDARGASEGSAMNASPSGSAFAYFSGSPFPQAVGNNAFSTEYLSTRSPAPAWSTQGVDAPRDSSSLLNVGKNQVIGFTEDLAKALVVVEGPPLAPPGVYDAFLRDSATGSFQLLAADLGTASDPIALIGASPDDSRVFFQTERQLLPAAAPGAPNLYEFDESKPEAQRLSLIGVLPDAQCEALSQPPGCAPPQGSSDGLFVQATQHPIAAVAARIFFAAAGRIYERLRAAEKTVQVSGSGAATFLAATPDGRYVFYSEAEELYRFDTATETASALTAGAAGVLGSLGVSADGSYAYFVAHGVLAANQNANGESAEAGADNLYRWHQGATAFLARLHPEEFPPGNVGDQTDWGGGTAHLDPAGNALLFLSHAPLTGYDSTGPCGDNADVAPCAELFLYDAAANGGEGRLSCVSCNPSGAPPAFAPHLGRGNDWDSLVRPPQWTFHLTRNLSADGSRVFFDTNEALLPADRNDSSDVYEWERPGAGSCLQSSPAYSPPNAGCLYLISTGTAHAPSYFGDASESGEDVFFYTRQPLVGQDRDLSFDVYDARVNGGIASQNPPPAEPECAAEAACKPHPTEPPAEQTGATEQIVGPPNPTYCRKGFRLKGTRCVKKHTKPHKHRKHHRAAHRRAAAHRIWGAK